jgi:hypothetical protein
MWYGQSPYNQPYKTGLWLCHIPSLSRHANLALLILKGVAATPLGLVFYALHRRLGVNIRLGLMPGGPIFKNMGCPFLKFLIK